MGFLSAVDMIEQSQDRHVALRWHLQHNHFPPVHEVFIETAEQAIDYAMCEDWYEVIEMPNGRSLTVGEIVRQLHLEAFLQEEDSE